MLILSRQKRSFAMRLQQGSVLIESMVALVIFSMGVLALVGLQSAMIKNSSDNRYRAEAQLIAQTHIANMMALVEMRQTILPRWIRPKSNPSCRMVR